MPKCTAFPSMFNWYQKEVLTAMVLTSSDGSILAASASGQPSFRPPKRREDAQEGEP